MVGRWSSLGLLPAFVLVACSFDFDRYDPAPSGAGGLGGSATTSAVGGAGGEGARGGEGGGVGGVGGAGGGGGGLGCGTTSLLADDFADGQIEGWSTTAQGAAVASETEGERRIALPSGAAVYGGFTTIRYYDLRGDRVLVEVPEMVDTTTTALAYLALNDEAGNFVAITQQLGTLIFRHQLDGVVTDVVTAPYDPVAHRYWQIREEQGTIHWETSSDGSSFTTGASVPAADLFSVALVNVELGAYNDSAAVDPGQVAFDDLNGGRPIPGARWCDLSSLVDAFDDVRGPAWARWYADAGCTMSEGGSLSMSFDGTVAECGYISSTSFDATGQSAILEVVSVDSGAPHFLVMRLDRDPLNGAEIGHSGGSLYWWTEVEGAAAHSDNTSFDPVLHRFWRIREAAGAVHYETSPDGVQWSELGSFPAPIPMDAVDIYIGAGFAGTSSPTVIEVDDFNVP